MSTNFLLGDDEEEIEIKRDCRGRAESFGLSKEFNFKDVFTNNYNDQGRATEKLYLRHCQNKDSLAAKLETDLDKGLNPNETGEHDFTWRENKWGNNRITPPKPNKILDHIIESFKDQTLQILLLAAIVSLIIGIIKDGFKTGWIDASAIFMAVFIVCSISSYMNWKQVETYNKLDMKNKIKSVVVIRNGEEVKVTNQDILVGDLMRIKYGNIAFVDGIVIQGKLSMDEGPVTGESTLMKKEPEFSLKNGKYTTPFVFSGSECKEGDAIVLVVSVGVNTFSGRNEALLHAKAEKDEEGGDEGDDDVEKTPLQKQLAVLADQIGNFGFIMAIIIGCAMVIKQASINLFKGYSFLTTEMLDVIVNAFIIAVTVIVVAIPEGLPMAVTISLTYSVRKMKKENNLVKCIQKSETMGTVTNVCTDKTGTLTKGEMDVVNIFIKNKDYTVSEGNFEGASLLQSESKEIIYDCIYKNISAHETINRNEGKMEIQGDMTESALFRFLKGNGFDTNLEKKTIYNLAFNSENGFTATVYENNSNYILYIKGAPEKIYDLCGKYLNESGNISEITQENKENIKNIQESYAGRAFRTLLFGYKELNKNEIERAVNNNPELDSNFFKELSKDFTFAFLTGIRDQYRPDVPDAIRDCKKAGITVRMVTGDNIATAIAISKDVGIIEESDSILALNKNDEIKEKIKNINEEDKTALIDFVENNKDIFKNLVALEGEVFRKISGNLKKIKKENGEISVVLGNKKLFENVIKHLKIIARASPEDKFLLVLGLKILGEIVAVTGDGTNDAPALSQAHVGFSMGIRGTDIAKNAADIVLLDDSFKSIVIACMYGRNVYDCIRKFVQFQLTCNIVAVFMTFMGGLILEDSPLNAIEMLWVNLIMDSFASLALATESPNAEILKRKPIKKGSSIINTAMFINVSAMSIFQITVLTIIIFYGDLIFNVKSDREFEHYEWNTTNGYHFTIFFNIFVFMQVFNSINSRKLKRKEKNVFKGIFNNPLYLLIQSIIILGQIAMITFGGRAVRVQRLNIIQHLKCIGIGAITLIIGFLAKFIPVDVE